MYFDTLKNSAEHFKENILLLFVSILLILINSPAYSQYKVFTLQNKVDQRVIINHNFAGDTTINPFRSVEPISGLAVSCSIALHSDSSLVRIILIDKQYNEFLICEFYPLLNGSTTFTLTDYAEETAVLNNIQPNKLKLEIIDASVYLKEIIISAEQEIQAKAFEDKMHQQRTDKIKRLNENIIKQGGKWVAGETSVSKMTYEEKKQLFGSRLPNLQGFEYYIGGIYGFPADNMVENKTVTSNNPKVVSEFDWRNRHGANKPGSPYYNSNPGSDGWITPVKDQGGCGSCYIFGPIGAVEAKVNLYFNHHIDIDLAEQHILSCNKYGASCLGASPNITLGFAQDSGVINESCFQYIQARNECSNKCSNPSERIRISGFSNLEGFTYEQIKKELIANGPLAANVSDWTGGVGHAMCLIGFAKISAGDTIYSDAQNHLIITPHDKFVGRTYLIFKNSWGTSWGNKGYVKVFEETMERIMIFKINNPIYSLNYSSSSISCNDFDGDGFYYWGLGQKPSYCPVCSNQPDGDDSDPCVGPMDEYGNLEYFTPSPVTKDKSVSAGDSVPELYAEGEKITWYEDEKQTQLLHTGNSFATGMVDQGVYTYYVTQTISGCESDIVPVKLTILPYYVPPPIAENVTVYFGDSIPELIAYGENIKWYADSKNILYDPRDGQTYNTTLIGEQLWMAENLNLFTPSGSWYYNNDSMSYAETYGRLYTWNTALNSCPINWHLPSDEEWMELEVFLGMNWIQTYKMGFRGYRIGYKLMETGTLHWKGPNPAATNEVNFNALPAGTYSPEHVGYQFEWLGTKADFLTATDTAYTEVIPFPQYFHRALVNNDGYIGRLLESCYSNAYSVRCVSYPSKPITEKKSYLPTYTLPGKYTYYVTQTISGTESPADTVIFTILSEVSPPEAANISVCENSQVPDLMATGKNIQWYSDVELTNLVHSGNVFSTGYTQSGIYKYYITQTILGFGESLADTVSLTIKPAPEAPKSENVSVCKGDVNLALKATGENIKWYKYTDAIDDARDGKTYNTVRIGNQLWMAENLNVGKQIQGITDQTNNSILEKYCYDDDPYNCNIYGGLYQWNELMDYALEESARGICPTGWHVPSHDEWIELEIALGMNPDSANLFEFRGSDQGIRLQPGGTSGFNAFMGGIRNTEGSFVSLNSHGTFWNSTGYSRTLSVLFPEIYASNWDDTSYGFSLRCVCDDSSIVAFGNTFNPGIINPDTYKYLVTQTVLDCESPATQVQLTVKPRPTVPFSEDISICEGESVPDLTAIGENVKWYDDVELTNLIFTGNTFSTGHTVQGFYPYYVSQTVSECESIAKLVGLSINPLPQIDLGNDTIIYSDQSIMLGPFASDYSYLWSDGSQNPYYGNSGSELGIGSHKISVIVSNTNGCINSDSVIIDVVLNTGINFTNNNGQISIFPNPAEENVNIDLTNLHNTEVLIKIYNQEGEEIKISIDGSYLRNGMLYLNISSLTSGMYYIQILTNKELFIGKFIVL